MLLGFRWMAFMYDYNRLGTYILLYWKKNLCPLSEKCSQLSGDLVVVIGPGISQWAAQTDCSTIQTGVQACIGRPHGHGLLRRFRCISYIKWAEWESWECCALLIVSPHNSADSREWKCLARIQTLKLRHFSSALTAPASIRDQHERLPAVLKTVFT